MDSIERVLTVKHARIHTEQVKSGKEAIAIQAVLRAGVVVIGMEMTDITLEHLICEMKRDIVRPMIIVCMEGCSEQARSRILRMGADEAFHSTEYLKIGALIEERLRKRMRPHGMSMARASLQRLFAQAGIPFDLKGYRYLEYAVTLLDDGEAKLEPIGALYERIGEKYGCLPSAVERNIRYAIGLCGSRVERMNRIGNRQFISQLMAQRDSGTQSLCGPKVSVFGMDGRLFH